MKTSTPTTLSNKNPILAALFSILPGAGQAYLGQSRRARTIFLTWVALGVMIYWAIDNFAFAKGKINGVDGTTWLYVPFVLFWLWVALDAFYYARGSTRLSWVGVLVALYIVYFLAWQVTDIRLERLVTRFENAVKVGSDIFHPDLITRDKSGAYIPSENFGDIFGRFVAKTAPAWMVNLGLAQADAKVTQFEQGKMVETIALGLLATLFSTLLAIPLSFFAAHNIMARLPGGIVIYYVMRTLLNVVRAIDTFIWGIIVVIWIGLGSFAGVMALTIHSIAALGKLFSEEIEHIDTGPIEALTSTGANLFQVVRYAVIPQIVPSFLAYTLLRWDINMRSATVVGFVAGGGIGFFVVEALRIGAYQQYAAALWAIAIVVIIVDYVSARCRERILTGTTHVATEPRPFYRSLRAWTYIIIGAAIYFYCINITGIKLSALFDPGSNFGSVVRDFLAISLKPDVIDEIVRNMVVTIFQALLATTLGALAAIPFSFLAARNLTGRSRLSIWIYYLARSLLNFLRSIEAFLYVAIFVYWVGSGNFAGMLALAVTTFALIGKLFSEAIENIDAGPLEAITATGATRFQAIVYGILPQIVPPFISYSIYQWDINVRISTIVGYAGGGGIGFILQKYFGLLQYHNAGTAVVVIVLVVTAMDFASAKIRERMV